MWVFERIKRRVCRRRRAPRRGAKPSRQTLEDGEKVSELAALGTSGCRRPASSRMLRAVTASDEPSTRYEPTTTSPAPTSCPTLMIVARLGVPDTGRYSCSTHARVAPDDGTGRRCPEVVGEEYGCRLAEPMKARLVLGILEGNAEDASLGVRSRGDGALRLDCRDPTRITERTMAAAFSIMLPQPVDQHSRREPPPSTGSPCLGWSPGIRAPEPRP